MPLNLPLKQREVIVEIEDADVPGITILLEALTDAEAATTMGGRVRTGSSVLKGVDPDKLDDDTEIQIIIEMPYDLMMDLFTRKVQKVMQDGESIDVDGSPFDPENLDHIFSIPTHWKMRAMSELIAHSSRMPKEMRKNSDPPGPPSAEVGAPVVA